MTANVLICRSCGAAKFVPAPGANPVCPSCDRAKCRRCHPAVPILDPKAVRCPECGIRLGLKT